MNATVAFYFLLLAGPLGADPATMSPKLTLGPWDDLKSCVGIGAMAISDLNEKHPDRDFAGACQHTSEPRLEPGATVLTLPDLVRAFEAEE